MENLKPGMVVQTKSYNRYDELVTKKFILLYRVSEERGLWSAFRIGYKTGFCGFFEPTDGSYVDGIGELTESELTKLKTWQSTLYELGQRLDKEFHK